MEHTVIFSAHFYSIRPIWILGPAAVYLICLLLSFAPGSRFRSFRTKKAMQIFAVIQTIFLLGHIYAFATELVPYYLHHYDIVEGDVEDFAGPADPYNRTESFRVNRTAFHYNYYDITFGYHDTVLDNGVMTADTANVRITYVHNPLNGENAIMRIELLQ